MDVATPGDLERFVAEMGYNGTKGTFNVTWYGRQQIRERVVVSDEKHVTITGVSRLGTDPVAANDAGYTAGLFFVDGESTLTLRSLTLDGGRSQEGGAIYVEYASVVNVFDCAFANNNASNGGAIYSNGSKINIDGKTSFINNSATSDVQANTGGGAIYAQSSEVKIDDTTSFVNNFAVADGGAILLHDGSEVFINGNAEFFNNRAGDDGGAIASKAGTKIHLQGSTNFTSNFASNNGGAIVAFQTGIEIHGSTHFTGNVAANNGGAVYILWGPALYIYGRDTHFTNNSALSGGAFFARDAAVNINGNTSFVNNSATSTVKESTGGGAIYAKNSSVNIFGKTCFIDNDANIDGGAIFLFAGSEGYINGGTGFLNNQAGYNGGAIKVERSGIQVDGSTHFAGNSANGSGGIFSIGGGSTLSLRSLALDGGLSREGGAIYAVEDSVVDVFDCAFTNNDASNGGAIYSNGSKVNIDGKTYFVNNSATSDVEANTGGGAIYAQTSEVEINGTTCFSNNFAVADGGAILLYDGSEVFIDGKTEFLNNLAGDDGGAIASKAETYIHLEGSTNFTSNLASNNGGAISAFQTGIEIYGSTHFTGNAAANNGGAVYILWGPALCVYGRDTYFTGNSALVGGAFFARDAEINIDGETSFVDNSATSTVKSRTGGGAIYAKNSTVNIYGEARFVDNFATFGGGAILLFAGSDVYINGGTDFFDNKAGYNGGAIKAEHSGVQVDGDAHFTGNTADGSGGAVYADNSSVSIEGAVGFINNYAFLDGGAVRTISGPGLHIYGVGAVFSNNSAKVGGAIHSTGGSLGIDGDITFANNSAVEFGGAVYSLEDDPVALQGNMSFVNNSAGTGGGAMSVGDPGELTMVGVNFTRNKANVGGAVSVTAVQNREREYRACRFESNNATADGGAIYFVTGGGSDNVTSSDFRGNFAANAGGAVYHREALVLVNTTFRINTAGEEGFAVLGSTAVALDDVSFVDNTFHCARGQYLYEDITSSADTALTQTRFELACARCSAAGSGNPEGVEIQNENNIPTCQDLPTGAKAVLSGTTVEGMFLEAGYYRTSAESREILECHLPIACVGGDDATDYCAIGYKGPYCAVFGDGFAPLASYNCRDCSDSDRSLTVGLVAAMVVVLVLLAALLSAYLTRAIDTGLEDFDQIGVAPDSSMEKRCIQLEDVFVKVFPLTSVKTVVVVWQIISQFAAIAGDVYPEEYANFVDKLSFLSFDIGFMLSYSCLLSTDFYDRLLLETIAPLAVLMALAGTYSVAKGRNQRSEAAIRDVQHKHLSAALFVGFLVYSSVSFTIFQTFVCETLDDGVPYLRADYSTTCDTDTYAKYRAYAILMVCVYPIGLPAILSWWLLRNRVHLIEAKREVLVHLEPFSGIWSPYKPSRYYYEVVECGRRIALTATASFVPPNSVTQIAVVLLVAAVLLFVSESMSPFSSSVDMSLYRWGNGIILASMYVALLLKVDVSSDQSSAYAAFGMVLIAANVFLVVTVAVQSILMVLQWHGEKRSARLVPLDSEPSSELQYS